MINKKTAAALALLAMSGAALTFSQAAAAQTVINQQPSGVLSLSAQSSAQVPQDVVNITLFYEQEAADPSSLTSTLNQHAQSAGRVRIARGKGRRWRDGEERLVHRISVHGPRRQDLRMARPHRSRARIA